MPVWETKCPARSRGWSSPGGELYKIMSVTILDRGEVCVFLKSGRYFSSVFIFKAANYMDVHQSFLLGRKTQPLCSRVQCKQAKKMVSCPSLCCASSACGFLWVGRWPEETTAHVCTSVYAKLVCFSSVLFCSPAKTCCCSWTQERAQQRESQHRGAAFSLLPALAIGNEAQGELQPPLLI